jgi:hypothetical protein
MITVRGLHNIKTHGSLDRVGLLVGVAKNTHRGVSRNYDPGDWSGQAARHLYVRKDAPHGSTTQARVHCLRVAQSALEELMKAAEEGFKVSEQEMQRLRNRILYLREAAGADR